MSQPDGGMSLVDHLTELRVRLVRSLICVVILSAGAYFFRNEILTIVIMPIKKYLTGGKLIYTAPMDKVLAEIKISFLTGILFSCPFWLYQVWKFIEPGLYEHEKKLGKFFIFFGTLLFGIGVSFVYFVVFDFAFAFTMTIGEDVAVPMISLGEYLSFFFITTLMFGVTFELPLILVLLGMLGVVSADLLKRSRRYAVVIIAVVSAVITPPDPISMICLMVPLYGLYELSIILVNKLGRRKDQHGETLGAAT